MSRNYNKIEEMIAETGFFSEYLPPCFKIDKKAFNRTPAENCDLIAPVSFTMSRYNGNDARRNIFIPEIGSYLVTREYMKQEKIIQELIEFSESSKVSFSPILSENGSIMRHEQAYEVEAAELEEISSNYIDNIVQKIKLSAGAKYILKLDISNCFASFYMHMIPAILIGIEQAEAEYNKCLKKEATNPLYMKYSKLDSIIRHQNLNRTNGLLTGTLYSKIISEAFLARIDKDLARQGLHFSRYVDDYEVYLYEHEDKQVISIFTKILKRYGFSLNFEKTELVEFPYYVTENLERMFQSRLKDNLNSAEVMELFNSFFSLEKSGTKGAIRYLLKTIEKKPVVTKDTNLYKSYLLTIIANNERSLTKACLLLINNKDTLILGEHEVSFVKKILAFHMNNENDLEVIWLLYLLIKTGNILQGDATTISVENSHNELAQLVLFKASLLSDESIQGICEKATSWILLYELYVEENMSEENFINRLGLRKNLEMYKFFKEKKLHFCAL